MKTRFTQIIAVHLLFIKNQKILLTRRHNTGYEDGNFSVPAGHVEENETCLEAAVRETKEEIDVKINESDLKLTHIMHRKSNGEHRIDFFFKCNKWSGKIKVNEPDKCDKLDWFSATELPANTVPYIKQAIEKAQVNNYYSELGF